MYNLINFSKKLALHSNLKPFTADFFFFFFTKRVLISNFAPTTQLIHVDNTTDEL